MRAVRYVKFHKVSEVGVNADNARWCYALVPKDHTAHQRFSQHKDIFMGLKLRQHFPSDFALHFQFSLTSLSAFFFFSCPPLKWCSVFSFPFTLFNDLFHLSLTSPFFSIYILHINASSFSCMGACLHLSELLGVGGCFSAWKVSQEEGSQRSCEEEDHKDKKARLEISSLN